MSHTVTILGAGGAMGRRITRAIRGLPERYELRLVEVSETGRQRMAEEHDLAPVELDAAIPGSHTVVLATPDRLVGPITADLMPRLTPGTNLLCLDPAAAHANRIPHREEINLYACHPTHPPLYDLLAEEDSDARKDYWGSGRARQAIVIAKVWGADNTFDVVERLGQDMFAPVSRSHRITVEQMALLEPGLSESVTNASLDIMRQARDIAIARGLPEAAVNDFFMGHLQIGIALIFDQIDWKMSAGAVKALDEAKDVMFKEDWARIVDEDMVLASTRSITAE